MKSEKVNKVYDQLITKWHLEGNAINEVCLSLRISMHKGIIIIPPDFILSYFALKILYSYIIMSYFIIPYHQKLRLTNVKTMQFSNKLQMCVIHQNICPTKFGLKKEN